MPSINSINYCPNCGSKRIQNANYCLECGFELKLLEQLLDKQNSIKNSEEEKQDNTLINNNTTKNSPNDLKENINISIMTNQKEINNDFEVIRPNTEEINENEDLKTEIDFNVTDNSNNEKNNFNLVRPNSQKNSVKKHKVKKNFSILNKKKI